MALPAERSQRIEQLYHAARERIPSERAAFLDQACAGDDALRREVESLLAEDDGVQNFLETPALESARKMSGEDAGQSMIGRQVGSYSVVSLLAKGGMGEVYRARDTQLQRDVALKLLPKIFASDIERLARFQREARVLASLNHPNIAQIYGLEGMGTSRCIVMELVDGETLEDRLKRGPIRVKEALAIAQQMTEALEAAHEKDIIHRDLKPANVKITPEGRVKVLDFGLAKPLEEPIRASSDSPTLKVTATETGVILGTAAYMSPEQARGEKIDKRTDMWAFGCLLYELLTGKQAFGGETVTDTLAAVLRTEPDWNRLPAATPAGIRVLLRRCLQKELTRRLRDATDARIEIQEALSVPSSVTSPEAAIPKRPIWQQAMPLALAGLAVAVLAGLAGWMLKPTPTVPPPPPVSRFTINLPASQRLVALDSPAVALSPDGARLVYVARVGSDNSQIYSRATDQLDAVPIRGTEGASSPFFSPDGQWIGFVSDDGKLKKVPVAGGPALTLCDAVNMAGATWLPDDSIVFRPGRGVGLWRVPAAGGTPQEFMKPDSKSEVEIRWPEVLPGGKAILVTIRRSGGGSYAIGALRLDTRERLVLVENGMHPHYLSSGHLVFARRGEILAAPFDVETLRVRGTPVPVIEDVLNNLGAGSAQFTASGGGSIAYIRGGEAQGSRALVWVDSRGVAQPVPAPKRNYEFPRLSPDGQRLAVRITGLDIWLYDLARGTLSRFTSQAKQNDAETPMWTPDGKRIAYAARSSAPATAINPERQIMWKLADGSAGEEILATSDRHLHLGGWSPKGDALVAMATDTGNIWLLQMNDKRTLRPLLQTPYQLRAGTISPDGRWLAYASNDTNRFEVYVQAFTNPAAKYQISTDGGTEPVWAKSGLTLFYRNGDKMMSVAIDAKGDSIEPRTPVLLFEGRFAVSAVSGGDAWYDVSPDGQRFLMMKSDEAPNSTASIVVVQDWRNELKRLAPAK